MEFHVNWHSIVISKLSFKIFVISPSEISHIFGTLCFVACMLFLINAVEDLNILNFTFSFSFLYYVHFQSLFLLFLFLYVFAHYRQIKDSIIIH